MPLYRGHVEISSGSLFLGHTEIEDGYQAVSKFYENDPNVTVTLNVIDNITGGNQYTVGGDLTGATSTGLPGQSYGFTTTVTPTTGYYFSTGPTINNASGTYSTNQTVNTTLAGNVAVIPPNTVVATAVFGSGVTNNTGDPNASVYQLSVTPSSSSGTSPYTIPANTFTPSATLLSSNYQWTAGPSFSGPSPTTITQSQNVVITPSATVEYKTGSIALVVTNSNLQFSAPNTSLGSTYDIKVNNAVMNTNGGTVTVSGVNWGSNASFDMSGDQKGPEWATYGYQFSPGIAYDFNSGSGAANPLSVQVPGSGQTVDISGTLVATIGRYSLDTTSSFGSTPTGAVSIQLQVKLSSGTYANYGSPFDPTVTTQTTGNLETSTTAGNVYVWNVVTTLAAGYTWVTQPSPSPGTSTITLGSDATNTVAISGTAMASLSSFPSSTNSRQLCVTACGDAVGATYYHDDSSGMGSVQPSVGDYVYTNAAGGTALSSGWYRAGASNFSKYAYQVVGASGLVQTVNGPGSSCGGC